MDDTRKNKLTEEVLNRFRSEIGFELSAPTDSLLGFLAYYGALAMALDENDLDEVDEMLNTCADCGHPLDEHDDDKTPEDVN